MAAVFLLFPPAPEVCVIVVCISTTLYASKYILVSRVCLYFRASVVHLLGCFDHTVKFVYVNFLLFIITGHVLFVCMYSNSTLCLSSDRESIITSGRICADRAPESRTLEGIY